MYVGKQRGFPFKPKEPKLEFPEEWEERFNF